MRRRASELKICIPCLTALFAFTVIDSLEACLKESSKCVDGPGHAWLPPPGLLQDTSLTLIQSGVLHTWPVSLTPPTPRMLGYGPPLPSRLSPSPIQIAFPLVVLVLPLTDYIWNWVNESSNRGRSLPLKVARMWCELHFTSGSSGQLPSVLHCFRFCCISLWKTHIQSIIIISTSDIDLISNSKPFANL